MNGGIGIAMHDGVRVCVPNDLALMTPYVLLEQEDWFEDEIAFLRRAVCEGDVCIDVGANFGVYTLALANRTGASGRIIAFEPCAQTAGWLRTSVALNGYAHVTVVESAVSDKAGEGRLTMSGAPELHRLCEDGSDGSAPVTLTTLDALRLPRVDHVKIDAEGHENAVIAGGDELFSRFSPLVMCEIKAGDAVDMSPVANLAERGYAAYRLAPGLGMLVPLADEARLDPYQLNLFCCKPDRAAALADAGLLAGGAGCEVDASWSTFLDRFPYARACAAWWKGTLATKPAAGWDGYAAALGDYAVSRDVAAPAAARHARLERAYRRLDEALEHARTLPRMLTLARIAADIGARERAVATLSALREAVRGRDQPLSLGEPFLSPSAALESAEPGARVGNWMVASVLDALERLRHYSSYFAPALTLSIVPELNALGFCREDMKRRYLLAKTRVKQAQG